MEDDKLKMLFSDFKPEMQSDIQFMNNLRRNLNAIESIKQQNADMRSRSRKAVAIAAFVGFIVGCLFSLSLPYLRAEVARWQFTLPAESVMNAVADNFTIIAWIVIGATSILAAINTYELSFSLLKPDVSFRNKPIQ